MFINFTVRQGSAWDTWKTAGTDWRAENPGGPVSEAAGSYAFSRGYRPDTVAYRVCHKAFAEGASK